MPEHQNHQSDLSATTETPPWPRLVFWETTACCNLECAHCRRLEVSRELSKRDLTTDEGKGLIDQLAECGHPLLILSGGEPLMRPDIFDLAEHARQRGLPCALATNGTLIDRAVAEKIAASGIRRVSVSLDGAEARVHDEFRRIAGSFERALAGISHVRSVGLPVQINMTLARHNAGQLEALFALTERIGAVALHVFALVPVGCGVEIADHEMLSAEECENTLRQFYELSKVSPLETRATCAPQYSRIVRLARVTEKTATQTGGGRPDPGRGCLAGSAVCFVSHEGKVYPCGYLPVEAGDVRREQFAEIWRNSDVFARLRRPELLTGKCAACEFVHVCMGCRARAFAMSGDFMGEEPSCPYVPRRLRT
ncbi:radical SAM protein [Candidatus Sumerlaeota bacterium]|nr:radical SAM protein [Candidatus Sumerlaeota bacterium]